MAEKRCPCGRKLDAKSGIGSMPGAPKILLCGTCYKDSKRPN